MEIIEWTEPDAYSREGEYVFSVRGGGLSGMFWKPFITDTPALTGQDFDYIIEEFFKKWESQLESGRFYTVRLEQHLWEQWHEVFVRTDVSRANR